RTARPLGLRIAVRSHRSLDVDMWWDGKRTVPLGVNMYVGSPQRPDLFGARLSREAEDDICFYLGALHSSEHRLSLFEREGLRRSALAFAAGRVHQRCYVPAY